MAAHLKEFWVGYNSYKTNKNNNNKTTSMVTIPLKFSERISKQMERNQLLFISVNFKRPLERTVFKGL